MGSTEVSTNYDFEFVIDGDGVAKSLILKFDEFVSYQGYFDL